MTSTAMSAEPVARSQWQLFRRRFFRHRLAMIGLVLLTLLFVTCFGARWIAPYPRNQITVGIATTATTDNGGATDNEGAAGKGTGSDILDQLLKDQEGGTDSRGSRPSSEHWFGTDILGRDYLTENLYAGQLSLKIGVTVALLSTVFGAIVGAFAGFLGRALDRLLTGLIDLFLIIPSIALLAIAIKKFGQSDTTVSLVLAALAWMTIARIVRAQVLSLKEREFVDAARVAGASNARIVFRHLLPNMLGPITVAATFNMAAAIVAESTLSFLGYGVRPPRTSWGNMLSTAEEFIGTNKAHLLYFPGLLILLTVLAINFLGDGLRDAFDPSAQR